MSQTNNYESLWNNFRKKYGNVRIWVVNKVGKKNVHSWILIREIMKNMEKEENNGR
jgi:hypothetical protein